MENTWEGDNFRRFFTIAMCSQLKRTFPSMLVVLKCKTRDCCQRCSSSGIRWVCVWVGNGVSEWFPVKIDTWLCDVSIVVQCIYGCCGSRGE